MQQHPKMLTAQEFVLVDEEGMPRANLAVDDGGQAAITFYDRNGNGRLIAGAGKDGLAAIRLKSKDDFPSAFIQVDEAGNIRIACLDKDGNNQFQLILHGDQNAIQIGLGGSPPTVLLQNIDGRGSLHLNNKETS